jgi:hypothetical protein
MYQIYSRYLLSSGFSPTSGHTKHLRLSQGTAGQLNIIQNYSEQNDVPQGLAGQPNIMYITQSMMSCHRDLHSYQGYSNQLILPERMQAVLGIKPFFLM